MTLYVCVAAAGYFWHQLLYWLKLLLLFALATVQRHTRHSEVAVTNVLVINLMEYKNNLKCFLFASFCLLGGAVIFSYCD